MARGNNKMTIFRDDVDYARFLEIWKEVIARFEVDAWVFCVMPNHYHLVFRTRRANLSLAIRYLNGTYAQWWNRRHVRGGHVFQGRFKAQVIEATVYLVRLCRYVILNPVRAALVAEPGDWRWSSYGALSGATPSPCADIDSLVRAIDPDRGDSVRGRLLDYVAPERDPEIATFIRSDCRVIGTKAFAARFSREAAAASTEVRIRERQTGAPPLTSVLADALLEGRGLRGGIRDAYALLYPIAEIARCAGLSPRTVASVVNAGFHGGNRRGTQHAVRQT